MMLKWRPESSLDLYKLVLGGFVFLSPWLFAFVYNPARLDAWASGFMLVTVSVAALVALDAWIEWFTLALGLWMAAAPWVLGLPHAATKIHVGAGVICAYLAALELWLVHYKAPGGTSSR